MPSISDQKLAAVFEIADHYRESFDDLSREDLLDAAVKVALQYLDTLSLHQLNGKLAGIAREEEKKAEARRAYARQGALHEKIAKAIKVFKREQPAFTVGYLEHSVKELEGIVSAGGRPAKFAAAAIVLKTSRHTHHHGSENHCEEHEALHEYNWSRHNCYPH